MKKVTNILTNSLIYMTILLSNLLCIRKILDADLFFDLRSAKDILTYGLDFKDHMSMFDGFKYLYHHWLYDLIIYPIFNLGSYPLLFITMLLIFFVFSILIYKFINKNINNRLISLLSTIVLIIFMGSYYYPRVQSLNYLLMLIEFIVIYKLYETGKIRYSIISIILSIILVNIHFPLWLLVPIFYLPYIAQMIIMYIKDKYKLKLLDKKIIIEDCSNNKVFIITFIIILLSCFISPYGVLPYTFSFEVMSEHQDVYSYIGEMSFVNPLKKPYLIICFIYFIVLLISKKKIKLSNLFYLLGLGIFGLMVYRNIPYTYTYFILIISSTLFVDIKPIKLKEIKVFINPIIISVIILELITIGMIIYTLDLNNYQYGIEGGGEPVELTNYIIDNLDYKNLKFYNEFETGSYLAYREIPTFVDSRVEVFVKKFNGKEDVMKDYHLLKPKELISKYKFDYIIVTKKSDMYKYMVDNNYEEVFNEYQFYYLFRNKGA